MPFYSGDNSQTSSVSSRETSVGTCMSDFPLEQLEQLYPPDQFPYFQDPMYSSKFYRVMHDVSGETRVQNHLVTIARETLLSYLRSDARLAAYLQEWSASIGLPEIERDIFDFLDRVVRRFGLSRHADLARFRRPPHISIEDFLPEWYRLKARLYAAYNRSGEVVDLACTYVGNELQLPWPWLAFRLSFDLFEQAHERALGITFVRHRTSYLDDYVYGPHVPRVTFPAFETKDGEPLDEAIRRRMNAAREDCNTLRAMACALPEALPKGMLRTDQEGNTRRNVRWFYDHRICQKTKYQIAKAYHAERSDNGHEGVFPSSCSCRQNVTNGIEAAERLLGMSPYIFSDLR
jgi:hypothetical protein